MELRNRKCFSRKCAQPRMPNKHPTMPHNIKCTMSPDRENGTSSFLYGWFRHLLIHLQTFLQHPIIDLLPAERKPATLLYTHYGCYYGCSKGIKHQKDVHGGIEEQKRCVSENVSVPLHITALLHSQTVLGHRFSWNISTGCYTVHWWGFCEPAGSKSVRFVGSLSFICWLGKAIYVFK